LRRCRSKTPNRRARTRVKKLNGQINDLNESRSKPGITQENDLNITKAIAILTEQVVVEEDKLRQMRKIQ
jgi:hypothetical protein